MTAHECPRCRACTFTWHMDDDAGTERIVEDGATGSTWWFCSSCRHEVQEVERRARSCPHCSSGQELWLVDRRRHAFWWCSDCRRTTPLADEPGGPGSGPPEVGVRQS